jgi:hypothetical protein
VHLQQRVGNVLRADLLAVLELEELVAAVARHEHEHVALRVGEQPLVARQRGVHAARQQPQKGLHSHLLAAVVDLHVLAVNVQRAPEVVEDLSWETVARVASHVVCGEVVSRRARGSRAAARAAHPRA